MSFVTERIELPHTLLTLYNNSILEIELNDNYFYTLKEAKEISYAMSKLLHNGKVRILLLAGSYSDCDEETRKFVSSDNICGMLIAMALITKSMAQDILGNFIIAFDKPPVEAKVFRSKENALKWILNVK